MANQHELELQYAEEIMERGIKRGISIGLFYGLGIAALEYIVLALFVF